MCENGLKISTLRALRNTKRIVKNTNNYTYPDLTLEKVARKKWNAAKSPAFASQHFGARRELVVVRLEPPNACRASICTSSRIERFLGLAQKVDIFRSGDAMSI